MNVNRREFTRAFGAGVGAALMSGSGMSGSAFAGGAGTVAGRPNLLVVCSDQHSGRMLEGGLGEDSHVRTPNLSRLARKGVCFRNAYCSSPVCAPARASLMTGRFASDVGSYGNTTTFDGSVPTWGTHLRNVGYSCRATGKLDLASGRDLGFTEVKTGHGHFNRPDITELFRRPMCYRVEERQLVDGRVGDRGKPDKALLDATAAFVKSQSASGQPFAAWVGITLPHPEFQAPEKYWALYPPEKMPLPQLPDGYLDRLHPVFQVLRQYSMISAPISEERVRRARAAYYGMITELDEYVGDMLDDLERAGALQNTIVIYTADHGEMFGDHGMWLKRALLEGAARVPLIMAGPGLPAGKIVDTPVSHVDLVATMLDLARAERSRELRGTSLLPLIAGTPNAGPRHVYAENHTEGNCTGSFLLRKGDWKYIYFSYYGQNLLFNLHDDPGELTNLAGMPATASIERELRDAMTSLVDPDAITTRAFEKQEHVLRSMVEKHSADELYGILRGRLGDGQAALLTQKEHAQWKPKVG